MGQAAYLFPQQNGQVRAYLIHHKATTGRFNGQAAVSQFIDESVRARAGRELYIEEKARGPLATYDGADHWVEHPYTKGVALIGDAAASSDPTWGEGMSLTLRDVRVLRDALLSADDWETAGHIYAAAHDQHYQVIHTLDNWSTQFFLEMGPEADARRARAFPLLAEDPTRLPDLLGLGPAVSTDETVRRRFFGEE